MNDIYLSTANYCQFFFAIVHVASFCPLFFQPSHLNIFISAETPVAAGRERQRRRRRRRGEAGQRQGQEETTGCDNAEKETLHLYFIALYFRMSSTSDISIKLSTLREDEIEGEVCPKQIKSRGPSPTNAAALQKSKSDEETRQVSQM